jgi:hypothetical protein
MRTLAVFLCLVLGLAGCVRTVETVKPTTAQINPYLAPPPKTPKPLFIFVWAAKLNRLIPRRAKPPAATAPQWAGSIRMVNTAEKFVLVESSTATSVVPGETYLSIGNSSETASLRMTNLKNPPFLIADIVSGDPSPGDKIYLPKATAQPSPPPAARSKAQPAPKNTPSSPAPPPLPDADPPLPSRSAT